MSALALALAAEARQAELDRITRLLNNPNLTPEWRAKLTAKKDGLNDND